MHTHTYIFIMNTYKRMHTANTYTYTNLHAYLSIHYHKNRWISKTHLHIYTYCLYIIKECNKNL